MDLTDDEIFASIDAIRTCPSGIVYEGLCKVAAERCFLGKNDEDGIYYLSESHAVCLRLKAEEKANALIYKIGLQKANPEYALASPLVESLCPKVWKDVVGFSNAFSLKKGCGLLERVKALPQEWTVIQVTAAYDPVFQIDPESQRFECPTRLYISRMNCDRIRPLIYYATVDYMPNERNGASPLSYQRMTSKAKSGIKSYIEELKEITEDNRKVNENPKTFKTSKDYWLRREKHNHRMKMLLHEIEFQWLQGWRCLFLGKLVKPNDRKIIRDLVQQVMVAPGVSCSLTPRSVDILSLIIRSYPILSQAEIHNILNDILPQSSKSKSKLLVALHKALKEVCSSSFKDCTPPSQWERYPVILVLDKRIECIPWEVMPLMREHPFSRVPSIHFVHGLSLNQSHPPSEIAKVDLPGKEANVNASHAYYVVNPDGSLPKTEERMIPYLETRPEKWQGTKGLQFTAENFFGAIESNEIVLYCGHGSGKQYLQRSLSNRGTYHVVMLLMGCQSVKTNRTLATMDSWGAVYEYMLARSPCVIGNLWEVTDLESDLVTMKLIDSWLGPPAEERKKPIPKRRTSKAVSKKDDDSDSKKIEKYESKGKLLHSVVEARYAAKQFMTSAALVSYGIPVIVKKEEK